jgi:hypothetical protein
MNPNCRSCRLSALCVGASLRHFTFRDGEDVVARPSAVAMVRVWRNAHLGVGIAESREAIERKMACIPDDKKWTVTKNEDAVIKLKGKL